MGLRRTRYERNGEDYIIRSFKICTHEILFGRSNENREMGEACSVYVGEERCIFGSGAET